MVSAQLQDLDKRFIRESGLAFDIASVIEPAIEDLGFRLVRVAHMGRGDKQTIQVMLERPDGTITIEDCETASRQLSPLLDAFDPIPGGYSLEVSSPGIDRPLVRPSDFENWADHEVKIELKDLIDGRKRFRGTIEGLEDGEIRLEVDLDQLGRQIIGLPLGMIAEAKLVLTDELVRESLRRTKTEMKTSTDDAASAMDLTVPASTDDHTK